jgi:hypothetical protein
VFLRHRRFKSWYPDKRRAFVVPIANAIALAESIAAAASGLQCTAKPGWLQHVEENRHSRVLKLRA